MQTENLIPITIWLCERSYRIKVKQEEEEAVRLAVKVAEKKVNELRQTLAGKDDQDFLAMCLIMYASDQVTEPEKINPALEEKLTEMIDRVKKITSSN